eukprot:1483358-Rhodomonas_salina.1
MRPGSRVPALSTRCCTACPKIPGTGMRFLAIDLRLAGCDLGRSTARCRPSRPRLSCARARRL